MPLPEVKPLDTAMVEGDLRGWLVRVAQEYSCSLLLAHTELGVLWGRFDGGRLVTAPIAFKDDPDRLRVLRADLTPALLWQARLFGPTAEVLLWPEDVTWRARALTDAGVPLDDMIDEWQMLWGDHAEARAGGFTLLADGREGLHHAVPLNVPADAFMNSVDERRPLRPVRLLVRHHIDYDEDGNARIARSRLCDLTK